mmetsp:Transcript_19874/g.63969  ORF Transcript_19874/g.63969 Transcript_19874/m.63969 type:complete len:136 (-) Transcript_19874:175-582(-)|eukprot:CAMPEP_0118897008 /NCGR_PEP_ID=MMETSP1166-20130328/4594_1 /TAXON_ID=1104430 /ORGANISM="Chrysoreinhardia sp, Strain CCMP3193" /LENGTH=135 /DNA_ID=CAMNT_0006836069 /DNA_START=23 /DNA_END=430 /DNA_ORIENTATION=+
MVLGRVVVFVWLLAVVGIEGFSMPPQARSLAAAPSRRIAQGFDVRQRPLQQREVARAQVKMGLFGLGVPEIAVILGIAGFVLGPEKLTSMAKDLGKVAGELKEVPKEFAEGLKETEATKPLEDAKATEPKEKSDA